jgi:hypothetical protein
LKKKTDAQFLISQIIKDEIQKNNLIKKSPKEKKILSLIPNQLNVKEINRERKY